MGLLFNLYCCSNGAHKDQKPLDINQDMIQPDDQIFDIIYNEQGHTFDDLHNYYLRVKETRSHDVNYDNVRRKIIAHMKLDNTLVEHEDKKIIEFYTNELLNMEYISDMQLLAFLLTKLKGYWEIEKIRKSALDASDRNIKYINENFPDPSKVLNQQGAGVTRLRKISMLKE